MSTLIRQRSKWRPISGYWPQQDQVNSVRTLKPVVYAAMGDSSSSNNINSNYDQNPHENEDDNNLIGGQELPVDRADNVDSATSEQWGLTDNSIKPTRPIEAPKRSQSERMNKGQPAQSSKLELGDKQTSAISSTIRLTMLEEPSGLSLEPLRQHNRARNSSSTGASTNLPQSQLDGPGEIRDKPHYRWPESPHTSSSSLAQSPNDNLQQATSEQYLLFLPSVSAILLLLGLILHFAYRRRVRANGKSAASRWLPLLLPSDCLRRASRKRLASLAAHKELADSANPGQANDLNQNFGCGGERIRLVERRPLTSFNHGTEALTKEGATVFEEEAHNEDEIIRLGSSVADESANEKEGDLEDRPSSIVILQRRLAKNSFVVAAKSTKPKVRLITARVRRFIDDEADELRKTKRTVGADRPLSTRLLTYFSTVLRRSANNMTAGDGLDEGCEMKETTCLTNKERSDSIKFEQMAAMDKIGRGPSSEADSLQPELVVATGLTIAAATTTVSDHLKLSPSPILNEACSSISACGSLFTPSPVENGAAQVCDCSINSNQLSVANVSLGIGLAEVRSKSQGHSPACQLNQANFRACCSVSPSALDAQLGPSTGERAACYHHSHLQSCHQQHQLVDHKLKLVSHFGAHRGVNTQAGERRSTFTAGTELISGPKGQLKSNNHIMRQYENYYEDEQADAYRRLTASIGMHFGHSQQIGDATTLGYAAHANMDNLLRFGCHHQTNLSNQGPFSGPHTRQPAVSLGFQNQLFPSIRPLCKCCHPPDACQNLDELRLGQNSCPEQRTLDQQLPTYSQWNAGSTSELPSSTSTSVGSDSGFISGANNYNGSAAVCQNPLCSCQRQVLLPAPPMSILVQQPSVTTPTQISTEANGYGHQLPPAALPYGDNLQQARAEIASQAAELCCTAQLDNRTEPAPTSLMETTKRPLQQVAALKSYSHRAKWRHRRRISHRRAVAESSSGCSVQPTDPPRESNPSVSKPAVLQHRASIASTDGSWARQSVQFQRHFSPQHQLNPHLSASQSHRPSDAAFFEPQFGEVGYNSKSNYSSSGGSSSGIGFSGSTCTNTPTSAFACDNFLTRQEPLIDFCLMSQERQMAAYGFQQQPQAHGTNRARTNPLAAECERLREQLGSRTSRKFSLPVQLESQASERASPNRSRLLFEKNLQRVDSTSLLQNYASPGEAVSLRSNISSQVSSPRQLDSRRNSQSITRQSSFWLEDNSVDSILSLTNNLEPQQAHEDDCAFAADEGPSDFPAPVCTSGQRASVGSLMQSGDSIESVRQKPTTRPPEPNAKAQAPTDADLSAGDASGGAKGATSGRPQLPRNLLRLSSSSTSSTTSSPSPDFSKPSGRLLGLASRSSSIAKRHLKLRPRRFARLSASSLDKSGSTCGRPAHQNSAPGPSSCKQRPLDESEEEDDEMLGPKSDGFGGDRRAADGTQHEAGSLNGNEHSLDPEFNTTAASCERASSDLNSASLERQCRDLWKLRATLHEDSCTADNWTNYHQRLNRRYDSGYKSIEKQLSSSLEGNILAAAAHLPAASGSPGCSQRQPDEPVRPQSVGLDAYAEGPEEGGQAGGGGAGEHTQVSPSLGEKEKKVEEDLLLAQGRTSIESVESKLGEFGLDDEAALIGEPVGRNCESRNSSKSGDEADKQKTAPKN